MIPTDFFHEYQYAALVSASAGVLPSVKLAQAALESGWGESELSRSAKNFFGIKADSSWKGAFTRKSTQEFTSGGYVTIEANFRAYPDPAESFMNHTRFLRENPRYSKALKQTNAYRQAEEIHKAGYATDPNYSDKLKDLIEKYHLTEIDKTYFKMKKIEIVQSMLMLTVAIITVYLTFVKSSRL